MSSEAKTEISFIVPPVSQAPKLAPPNSSSTMCVQPHTTYYDAITDLAILSKKLSRLQSRRQPDKEVKNKLVQTLKDFLNQDNAGSAPGNADGTQVVARTAGIGH